MSKKQNSIKSNPNGVEISLDPNFLLKHALYMPDGETIVRSNMTLGQAIEAIAYAHIKAKMPHLLDKCLCAYVRFENGRFQVTFADGVENLSLAPNKDYQTTPIMRKHLG